jgi:hypothetical protein
MIIPFLPNSSTQTEGKYDRQQLDGCHNYHHPYHDVKVISHYVGELVIAARIKVGVRVYWVADAGWVFWPE